MRVQTKYPKAGFWVRALALLIDTAVIVGVVWALSSVVLHFVHLPEMSPEKVDQQDLVFFVYAFVSCFYTVGSWRKWEATPGKRLLGISVVSATDGSRVSLSLALVRWMTYVVSFGLFGVGFLMVIFHPRGWALHDVLGRTQVVRKPRAFGLPST